MNTFSNVPPGFRFHPTDEELVDYYLRKKIAERKIDLDIIKDVDLYKIEPWDLQELCKIGCEDQNEWYFFSHKDKKYPTGTRTNRATKAGFWKATGRDKAIYSKHCLIGMRKTLVFYKGRAPNGHKSDWIMHEYRLETNENGPPQEEGWVVCRVFKKRMTTVRKMDDSPCWYDDHVSFMPDHPNYHHTPNNNFQHQHQHQHHHHRMYPCNISHLDPYLQLPQLESPKMAQASASSSSIQPPLLLTQDQIMYGSISEQLDDQVTDWRVLDKFVASQLSEHDCATASSKDSMFPLSDHMNMVISPNSNKQHLEVPLPSQFASTSSSTSQTHMWN